MKLPNFHFMLFEIYWSHVQKNAIYFFLENIDPICRFATTTISNFPEDIDPIRKILKDLLHGSSGFVESTFSEIHKMLEFQNRIYFQTVYLPKMIEIFARSSWSILLSPKLRNSWFWESRTRPQIWKPWTWGFLGFPKVKSKRD